MHNVFLPLVCPQGFLYFIFLYLIFRTNLCNNTVRNIITENIFLLKRPSSQKVANHLKSSECFVNIVLIHRVSWSFKLAIFHYKASVTPLKSKCLTTYIYSCHIRPISRVFMAYQTEEIPGVRRGYLWHSSFGFWNFRQDRFYPKLILVSCLRDESSPCVGAYSEKSWYSDNFEGI